MDDVSLLVLSPRSENMAEQLYRYLLMTCTGVAQKRVTAVGEGEGFAAWKVLATHHDPRSRPHRTAMMAEILGFSFAGDLTTKIVEFDDILRLYAKRVGKEVDSDTVVGTFVRNLPASALRTHIVVNLSKHNAWEDIEMEVDNFRRAQITTTTP